MTDAELPTPDGPPPDPATDPAIAARRVARRGAGERGRHVERHSALGTTGWLRPFVLGAEDGIVSTAGLVLGVAAAGASTGVVLAAGIAGLSSGALSMAAGEYVSVAAQRDTEEADIARERWELAHLPDEELAELASLYESRGLDPHLALQVAREFTAHDALAVHLREELAIDQGVVARPWQAAWLSAVSFSVGAALPLAAIVLSPHSARVWVTAAVTIVVLAAAGTLAAKLGRSKLLAGAIRVMIGGAVAMAVTWFIGSMAGVQV